VLLAALAFTGAQLACAANSADTPLHVPVTYADLDLSTSVGITTLYRRLHAAAEKVCEPLDRAYLSLASRYRACVQKALSNSVRQVDKPMLTQYYAERSGDVHPATVALAK
jgi:UrcA family protein